MNEVVDILLDKLVNLAWLVTCLAILVVLLAAVMLGVAWAYYLVGFLLPPGVTL
jgi:hypothetical protein